MLKVKNSTLSSILGIRNITDSTYILRLEKLQFDFRAGQYLILSIRGEKNSREYSVYSPEDSPYLDLLIKEVADGDLSRELKTLQPGAKVTLSGPFGFFILRENSFNHYTFIATGTGISPFHSMILSNPGLNCQLLHGIKFKSEAYDSVDYPDGCYTCCISRDSQGDYHGRVTGYLREHGIRTDSVYYLCGNSDMVNEVTELLEAAGILPDHIRTEVFF